MKRIFEALLFMWREGGKAALRRLEYWKLLDEATKRKLEERIERYFLISRLIDFAEEKFSDNVDENWALCTLSSVLIENIVRGALLKLGIELKRKFEDNARTLVEEVGKIGIKIDFHELMEAWGGRGVTIHEVYRFPVSSDTATRSYQRALRLLNKLSSLFIEKMYIVDWSTPLGALKEDRVIVVGDKAYHMGRHPRTGEDFDEWAREKIRSGKLRVIQGRGDHREFLRQIGIHCMCEIKPKENQPPSIKWLEEQLSS